MPVIERWRALLRMGFARGEQRSQGVRFPVSLDELIPEDHLVRVIDLWVDRVEVARLGFAKAAPKATGRPPYDPADLLKLYLYGYLNQIRSSVALMTEMEIDHHVRGETEARLMKTAQGPSRVAYNVQSAVDAEHGLILHHEVTQEASDNRQLAPMADAAKAVLAQAQLTVVADAGYSNGEHLTHCAEAQVTAFVPPERAVNNQAKGTLFQKRDFSYDAGQDAYRCPAGAGSSANRSPTRTGSSFTPPQRVQAARAGTLPGPSGDDETAPGHRRTPLRNFEGARLR